jgi:transposase InsO family protein
VLYRRFYKPDGIVSHLQVIMPPPLRKAYIMHTHCVSGHFGVAKVTAEIAKRVYFPGWKSLTEMVLKTCDTCCRYRRGEAPKQTPLRPVLAARPMDVLQVDLVGPLNEGRKANGQRGFYYILTAIDLYSKFLFTAALRNKTAEVVAAALVDIMLRVGLPSRIASDLGNEFQAKIVCDVNRMLGIEQLRSTSMRPTTQASVERVHRTMHALFAKCEMLKVSEWPDYLPKITLAHNMAVHSSTSYTPYYLFHGREGICPLDLLTEVPAESVPADVHEYALTLAEQLRYAFNFVQEHANTRIERMKKAYDAHVRQKTFNLGQLVYYYYPRARKSKYHKWQLNYLGVYKIIKVLNSTNCIIQRTPKSKAFVAHFDKLKPYLGDIPAIWQGHKLPEGPLDLRPTVDTGLAEATELAAQPPAPTTTSKVKLQPSAPKETPSNKVVAPHEIVDLDGRPVRPTRERRLPVRYR